MNNIEQLREMIYSNNEELSQLRIGNIVEIDNIRYEIVRINSTPSQTLFYGITLPDSSFDTIVFDSETPVNIIKRELTGKDLGDLLFNITDELYVYDNEGFILKHKDCDEYKAQIVNLYTPYKQIDTRYVRLKLDETIENQESFVLDFIIEAINEKLN